MAHRILILTNRTPYPFKDGGNLAMRAMIEGYYQAGWEVYLLAMNTKRHPVPDNELRTAYAHIKYVETVPVDNHVKLVPALSNYLFSKQPNHAVRFYHSEYADAVRNALLSFKPDIVQLESLYLATYLPIIKQHSGAKTILRVHNIEHEVWQRLTNETSNLLKKAYLKDLAKRIRKFEHDIWPQFDLLLPITSDDANAVQEVAGNINSIVVPFAIDTSLLPPPRDNAAWNAYHIGAMDWLPNVEAIKWFLDDVWPAVHSKHPNFKFFFAGRNMPLAFQQRNMDGVICAGEVADAADFIADKKILVVPLRSGGGIRVKILEAMAAGKIVISTSVGMQGVDAVPGTHYLLANTPAEFSEKLNWCLDNKENAVSIALNAAVFIRDHYSYKHIMDGFISNVEQLLRP